MDSSSDWNNPVAAAAKPTTIDGNPSASDNKQKLSLMNRKFLMGGAFIPNPDRDKFLGFRLHYIFLYGTLMDPTQLQKGQYPTLVFKPSNVIHGMAYEVQKESHIEYLQYYKTEAYKIKGCRIKFANSRDVPGKTFIYNGDMDLLREGTFNLKDWQMEQLEKKS